MKRTLIALGLLSASSAALAATTVTLDSAPTLICQGPTYEAAGWGPYQFPTAYPLGDGRIAVSVFVSKDDFTAYGDPCRWFVTTNGTAWTEVAPAIADRAGVRLPNGEIVSFPLESSPVLAGYTFTPFEKRIPDGSWKRPAVGKCFPVPDGARGDVFGGVAFAYRAERVPAEFREANWLVKRLVPGAEKAVAERARVDWPFFTRVVHASGSFSHPVLKTVSPKCKAKMGPDGALWVSTFSGEGHINPASNLYAPYYSAEIFRSEDGGRTFTHRSHIEYPADGKTYPYASGGFSDNDFAFMPDGSMIIFMRSNWYGTTGEEQSPMYFARSTDMGRTWSRPERFTDLGTCPQIARLANGAYVVMYGRPGLFVRVCEDRSGLRWSPPVELLTAGDRSALANAPKKNPSFHDWDGECGNGSIVPLTDDTALALYGDFYWPDAKGVKRKSILSRRVRIIPDPAVTKAAAVGGGFQPPRPNAPAKVKAPERIARRKPLAANVGIVSVGLDTYWAQCPGLLADMKKKEDVFAAKLAANAVSVSRFGLSDNPVKAKAMIPAMKAADLDVLFVDMVTYATSSTFAPFVRELNVPIVLCALQPDDALDYAHATIYKQLFNDDLCSVPEFTGVAVRYGRPVADVVIGRLSGDGKADEEIRQWCAVAHVLHDLRRARIGLMGHVLEAMYDMQVDPTAVCRTFGCHVALCEPDEILPFYRSPVAADVEQMKRRILSFFDTPDPVSDPWTEKLTARDLDVAARAACALERFIEKRNLDGFAYYYEGEAGSLTRELVTNFIVGNSLLTAAGFPMCGEFDLKNCVAMMIFDRLDIGGSFAEFHPIDFSRDTVLVGHDGPHHLNIAQAKPVLRSLKKYHGKPGKGAGVEFNIKEGPITMLSIGLKADGSFKFIVAEGESLKGPIPATGNTNTHGKFPPDVRTFLRRWTMEGPTHHFALGIGHHAAEIRKLGRALGIETVVVTDPAPSR